MRTRGWVWWVGIAVMAAWLLLVSQSPAQVVRESASSSVARVLSASYDEFTLVSGGEEIVFADLDSDVYQTRGRGMHEDEEGGCGETTVLAGGCSGEDEGGCDSGTEPHGQLGLCLQVLRSSGELLCWADRPARPGWQRDPALACPLPSASGSQTFTLRVALRASGELGCGQSAQYPTPPDGFGKPYLLNVSVRRIAPTGPLNRAAGISHAP